jgi:hypothetical protein
VKEGVVLHRLASTDRAPLPSGEMVPAPPPSLAGALQSIPPPRLRRHGSTREAPTEGRLAGGVEALAQGFTELGEDLVGFLAEERLAELAKLTKEVGIRDDADLGLRSRQADHR